VWQAAAAAAFLCLSQLFGESAAVFLYHERREMTELEDKNEKRE
jgi:hypothetical protein